ncbi:MAG: hypothetical protein ACOCRA_01965, partial [Halobacteria archaeon]
AHIGEDLAHKIRTPLAVLGQTDKLADGPLGPDLFAHSRDAVAVDLGQFGLCNRVVGAVPIGLTPLAIDDQRDVVRAIERALDIEPTLLGVDVWRDGRVVVRDGSEDEILGALGDRNVVVVSPLGGQGFVVGRGNQQISPEVLSRSELELVATRDKLRGLDALRIDTGDTALDEKLRGWRRVRVGRDEWRVERVV